MTGGTKSHSWGLHAGIFAGSLATGWLVYTGVGIAAASERASLIAAIWRHIGYGAVLTPLLGIYLLWRVLDFWRRPVPGRVGVVLFWSMIGILTFLLVSGPVIVWTYGFPVRVFEWFAIPNPVGKMPVLHDPLEYAHVVAGYAAAVLIPADFIAHVRRRLHA